MKYLKTTFFSNQDCVVARAFQDFWATQNQERPRTKYVKCE